MGPAGEAEEAAGGTPEQLAEWWRENKLSAIGALPGRAEGERAGARASTRPPTPSLP